MKQASKKELIKHTKAFDRELGHSEGNCWCNCKVRGYRHYLASKLLGSEDIEESTLQHYENLVQSSPGAISARREEVELFPGDTIKTEG